MNAVCPICGAALLGNGYTRPVVCVNAAQPDCAEPDSGPWLCVGGASTGPDGARSGERFAGPRTAGGFPALGGGGRGVGANGP